MNISDTLISICLTVIVVSAVVTFFEWLEPIKSPHRAMLEKYALKELVRPITFV